MVHDGGSGGKEDSPSGSASGERPDSSEPSGSASGERNDKFRQGRIIKFFPHLGYGFVRDLNGKEIYFHLDEVRLLGPKKDRFYLVEGAEAGFDVGITSRGLRVTRLKVY